MNTKSNLDGDHDGIIQVENFSFDSRETRLTVVLYLAINISLEDSEGIGLKPLRELVSSLHDHEGLLTVYWKIKSPHEYYKKAFSKAWECVREDPSNVEHQSEPELAF